MTAKEFRAARIRLGLSQAELAKRLRLSKRSIVYYEALGETATIIKRGLPVTQPRALNVNVPAAVEAMMKELEKEVTGSKVDTISHQR